MGLRGIWDPTGWKHFQHASPGIDSSLLCNSHHPVMELCKRTAGNRIQSRPNVLLILVAKRIIERIGKACTVVLNVISHIRALPILRFRVFKDRAIIEWSI